MGCIVSNAHSELLSFADRNKDNALVFKVCLRASCEPPPRHPALIYYLIGWTGSCTVLQISCQAYELHWNLDILTRTHNCHGKGNSALRRGNPRGPASFWQFFRRRDGGLGTDGRPGGQSAVRDGEETLGGPAHMPA